MISEQLGRVIRNLRLSRDLSQTDFALRCQINRGYLSRVECGKTVPFWENMERFASVLGMGVWEIIQLAEVPAFEVKQIQMDVGLDFKPKHSKWITVEMEEVQIAGEIAEITLSQSYLSQPPGDEVLSSRTGLPDSPLYATIEFVDDQHLGQQIQHDTLHPAPQSTVQPETESQESIPAEATGTDIYRVSGSGHPTLIEAASHSPSPVYANEPISEPELETSTFGGWQVI